MREIIRAADENVDKTIAVTIIVGKGYRYLLVVLLGACCLLLWEVM